jgi:hypothetical protein
MPLDTAASASLGQHAEMKAYPGQLYSWIPEASCHRKLALLSTTDTSISGAQTVCIVLNSLLPWTTRNLV